MHAEGGMWAYDLDCVRERFARAFDRKGGILAVIGEPGGIRAMSYIEITRAWYTRENHIEELFCWVHPEHRKSDYGRLLIEYAKKCSDDISENAGIKVPLLMGVLTNRRMEAKVRLYRRHFGPPAGAVFVHNPSWVASFEPCEADVWRLPAMAKLLTRAERREARVAKHKQKLKAS
jgi:GNAT superfamily N-acetyltransferase